jgi:hypothetical protein
VESVSEVALPWTDEAPPLRDERPAIERTRSTHQMLYLGPEVVAPLLSVLAAIGGVLMMFWRRVAAMTRSITRVVTGKPRVEAPADQDRTA